jgi:hypothetical protein
MLILMLQHPNAPYSTMGDVWDRAAQAFDLEEDCFVGLPGMKVSIDNLPRSRNEIVTSKVTQALLACGFPTDVTVLYRAWHDKKKNADFGLALALRPTPIGPSEAPKKKGVVMRCASCGNISGLLTVRSSALDSDRSLDYAICSDCNNGLLGNDTIVTCWCGYRFLSGFARWYFEAPDRAVCPNCGLRLEGSGAVKMTFLGLPERL